MDDHLLWNLMRESWIKIEASFDSEIKPIVAESDLNIREWMMLIAALTFEPVDFRLALGMRPPIFVLFFLITDLESIFFKLLYRYILITFT